jgi:hypothetical protein
MGLSVNHQRTCATDSLTTVVIEYHCFFAVSHETIIQDVEHLQERGLVGDFINLVRFEMTFGRGAILTPNLERDVFDCVAHL